jgi:hydrogenase maturation factor HypE
MMVLPVVIQTAKAMDCIRTMMTDARTLRNGDMIALDDKRVGVTDFTVALFYGIHDVWE